jgi:hypothetical protein
MRFQGRPAGHDADSGNQPGDGQRKGIGPPAIGQLQGTGPPAN